MTEVYVNSSPERNIFRALYHTFLLGIVFFLGFFLAHKAITQSTEIIYLLLGLVLFAFSFFVVLPIVIAIIIVGLGSGLCLAFITQILRGHFDLGK